MDKKEYGAIAIKDDCQMYNNIKGGEGTCRGLKQLYCKREKCNFYKSWSEKGDEQK